jgi:uncharacterized protein
LVVRLAEAKHEEPLAANPGILASVSQENVDLVRRMYDAYARGEVELGLSYLDPEIEFSQPAGEPGAGTYHGHEGVVQAFASWTGAWDDYRVDVDELIDFGDHVLARTRHRGRGKGSGVEVEHRIFQLWTLHRDKVVRARMYYEEAEALEAVGVRPSEAKKQREPR